MVVQLQDSAIGFAMASSAARPSDIILADYLSHRQDHGLPSGGLGLCGASVVLGPQRDGTAGTHDTDTCSSRGPGGSSTVGVG